MTDLGTFEGRTVIKSTVALRNAGDGLSKAIKTAPVVLRQGDTVYVLYEAKVGPITFKPIEDSEEERLHVLIAGTCALVDKDFALESIEKQRAKNDEAAGRLAIDGFDMADAHGRGEHKRKRGDCPACQREKAEAAAAKAAAATQRAEKNSPAGRRARTKR